MDGICADYENRNLPRADFRYYEKFLEPGLADFYFETFSLLPFQQGEVSRGTEKRKSCFFSDRNDPTHVTTYMYAGKENPALDFTDEMRELKLSIEQALGCKFNSCLVNLYETGRNVIGMHSDSEKSLVPGHPIASISLGAERWFDVVPKCGGKKDRIRMKHGSMIVMGGEMQQYYKHGVPQEVAVTKPRINLTFRMAK